MVKNSKILIIDDEPHICDSLKTLLCSRNYEVQSCNNGNDALNHLKKVEFDLILLDIFMEEMDGFQVFEKIINQKIDSAVIIITGNASTDSYVKALRMGASDYLKTPFEPEELLLSVKNALNHRQVGNELKHQTKMQKILMDIATDCINPQLGKKKDTIQSALEKIGKFVCADRTYVFDYDFEENIAVNTYEWCNTGVEPQIENLQSSPLEDSPDFVEPHLKGEPLIIPDVSALPSGVTKEIFEQQNIKSLVTVPLFNGGSLIGFTGFDSVNKFHAYSDREIELLQFFAQILVNLRMHIEAENELLKSEQRFRTLFEKSPDAIFIESLDDHIIDANAAASKMLGFKREEFQTMTIADLQAQEIHSEVGSILRNELTHGKFFEGLDVHKDGTIIPVEGHNHQINLKGQKIVLSVVRDISERKQAEKEKIEMQKITAEKIKLALVGQIAGKMAHDFNNILGIVMGNTELALLDCKDPQTKKTLELIFEQTLRGKNLTKTLVAFAKDQEPKQHFFSVNEKIELVLNLLKKELEDIRVIRDEGLRIPDLLADPGMIEHALVNLVQNSIHATSMVEQPQIAIRTFHKDKNIYIEIEDNGCGIPEEIFDRIYEPAFTMKGSCDVSGSYKPGIKGTGYGMANVKKYIEQHKGNIIIDSNVGKGTKITITLPVIKKELTEKEVTEIQKENFSSGKSILLVEDEQAISDVQYKILTSEPCNHKVDVAGDGQVAIDLFKRNEYDLISLDYVLPGGIHGMDVYDHVRKTNKIIPILFISGNIEFLESIKDLKQKDNNIDHLSKPCQNKDYVKSINELFERNCAQQE